MNRRTFLISSLAAFGTGLFLSKEGKARTLVSRVWAEKQCKDGKAKAFWLPEKSIIEEAGKAWKIRSVRPNAHLFLNLKNGERYMCSVWYYPESNIDRRHYFTSRSFAHV